jgi:hypothetical protein
MVRQRGTGRLVGDLVGFPRMGSFRIGLIAATVAVSGNLISLGTLSILAMARGMAGATWQTCPRSFTTST